MGFIKNFFVGIIKKIVIIALIVAFFAFGGYTFVKERINAYQNPPRNEFISSEKDFADFSLTSQDYQLCRDYNLFGYKKIHAKYLPTGQKITLFKMKNNENFKPLDLMTNKADNKIKQLLDKTKDFVITFDDFNITQRGILRSKNGNIYYIKYNAKVKNIPFKNVTGILASYTSSINTSNNQNSVNFIHTMTDTKAFNIKILQNFVITLKL